MFSATLMCGNNAYFWNTIAMSRLFGATLVTSRPPMVMLPACGCSKPASIINSVVLPDPDGPSSDTNSPAPMSSDTSSTATTAP